MKYKIKWVNLGLYIIAIICVILVSIWSFYHLNRPHVVYLKATTESKQNKAGVITLSNMDESVIMHFTGLTENDTKQLNKKNAILLFPKERMDFFSRSDKGIPVFKYFYDDPNQWVAIKRNENKQGLYILRQKEAVCVYSLEVHEMNNVLTIKPVQLNANKLNTSQWDTLNLVNANKPYNHVDLKLFDIRRIGIQSTQKKLLVQSEMIPELLNLIDAGKQSGFQFVIVSGFRNEDKQAQIFNEKMSALKEKGVKEAENETAKTIQYPGSSEHHTGYAVDVLTDVLNTTQSFYNSREANWLEKNCSKYGFVLRYPDGKEDKTHISYEPWHLRYVGMPYAKYMDENNITLEELIEKAKNAKVEIRESDCITVLIMSENKRPNAFNYSNEELNCKIFNVSNGEYGYEWRIPIENLH